MSVISDINNKNLNNTDNANTFRKQEIGMSRAPAAGGARVSDSKSVNSYGNSVSNSGNSGGMSRAPTAGGARVSERFGNSTGSIGGGFRGERSDRGSLRPRRPRIVTPTDSLQRLTLIQRRVSATNKRGRNQSSSVAAAVGNENGSVGIDVASAKEMSDALRKACNLAQARMVQYPMWDKRTLPHDICGHHGVVKVVARRAPTGTGIIAGGVMQKMFEAMGIKDVVAKVVSGQNPINVAYALRNALNSLNSPSSKLRRANMRRYRELASSKDVNKVQADSQPQTL